MSIALEMAPTPAHGARLRLLLVVATATVTAYITKGRIRSQLKGGPLEIFDVGQSFFEPPGAIHLVSANASTTDWAELVAIFVADEGAQLTTLIEP